MPWWPSLPNGAASPGPRSRADDLASRPAGADRGAASRVYEERRVSPRPRPSASPMPGSRPEMVIDTVELDEGALRELYGRDRTNSTARAAPGRTARLRGRGRAMRSPDRGRRDELRLAGRGARPHAGRRRSGRRARDELGAAAETVFAPRPASVSAPCSTLGPALLPGQRGPAAQGDPFEEARRACARSSPRTGPAGSSTRSRSSTTCWPAAPRSRIWRARPAMELGTDRLASRRRHAASPPTKPSASRGRSGRRAISREDRAARGRRDFRPARRRCRRARACPSRGARRCAQRLARGRDLEAPAREAGAGLSADATRNRQAPFDALGTLTTESVREPRPAGLPANSRPPRFIDAVFDAWRRANAACSTARPR